MADSYRIISRTLAASVRTRAMLVQAENELAAIDRALRRSDQNLKRSYQLLRYGDGGYSHVNIGATRSAHASSLCVAPSYSA